MLDFKRDDMRKLYLIFFLLPLSCLAQKQLVPLDYNTHRNSNKWSVIESEGITVYAECLEFRRDLLVFDVEVKNETGDYLTVDPQEMYIYGSQTPLPDIENDHWEDDLINGTGDFFPFFTQSERSIGHYYERKIKSKEATKTLMAVLVAGLMIYDVVKDGQDFASEPSISRINKSAARDVAVSASVIASDVATDIITESQVKTDEDRYYLAEEYLRGDALENGETIRGKVYFTPNMKYRYYRLMIPTADFVMVFDFKRPGVQ